MSPERTSAQAEAGRSQARPAKATARQSRVAEAVLGLQQAAGNAAVSQAVAAQQNVAAAPAPPAGAANPNTTAQFGAVWDGMVVVPLARAYDKLTGPKPDDEAALSEIDTALRAISMVKTATPADDENRIRIEILEVRVTGLRDFIHDMRAKGKSKVNLEQQLIVWRAEAVALGEELVAGPLRAEQGPSATPDAAGISRRQELGAYWKKNVIDDLWTGQKNLAESPDEPISAATYLLGANHSILLFLDHIPPDFPNPLRFIRLERAVSNITDIVHARSNGDKSPASLAEDAYDLAVTVGKHLTGQPVDDEPESPGPGEPDFTWESREEQPFVNDTELERP